MEQAVTVLFCERAHFAVLVLCKRLKVVHMGRVKRNQVNFLF